MKKSIRIILPMIMAMIAIMPASAQKKQGNRPSREQFTEAQATKIANELMLDEPTAKQFITLFTQCQQEIWAVCPKGKAENRDKSKSTMTEEEAQQIIKERFAHRQQINGIQEKYYAEFSKILTQRQILRMYDLEKNMMDRMFRERTPRKQQGKSNKQVKKVAKQAAQQQ